MILSFVNIRKVPREMLKTSCFALGFQHLPRDLANVNECKIMFDPYITYYSTTCCIPASTACQKAMKLGVEEINGYC